MRTRVVARFSVEGFHAWPGAGGDAAFLASRHRHVFHVAASVWVEHADRDVEFILLGRGLRLALTTAFGEPAEFGAMSCEHVARWLIEACEHRWHSCEVSEDGENGAVLEVEP